MIQLPTTDAVLTTMAFLSGPALQSSVNIPTNVMTGMCTRKAGKAYARMHGKDHDPVFANPAKTNALKA
jgi:hypothetical protein